MALRAFSYLTALDEWAGPVGVQCEWAIERTEGRPAEVKKERKRGRRSSISVLWGLRRERERRLGGRLRRKEQKGGEAADELRASLRAQHLSPKSSFLPCFPLQLFPRCGIGLTSAVDDRGPADVGQEGTAHRSEGRRGATEEEDEEEAAAILDTKFGNRRGAETCDRTEMFLMPTVVE